MDESFHVDVTRAEGVARLSLVGELDAAAVPTLAGYLETADDDTNRVVIDLDGLTFIDSSGVEAIRAAERRSVEVMSARHPCRGVRRVFEATGLERLID